MSTDGESRALLLLHDDIAEPLVISYCTGTYVPVAVSISSPAEDERLLLLRGIVEPPNVARLR
jgi:hypothetical protein